MIGYQRVLGLHAFDKSRCNLLGSLRRNSDPLLKFGNRVCPTLLQSFRAPPAQGIEEPALPHDSENSLILFAGFAPRHISLTTSPPINCNVRAPEFGEPERLLLAHPLLHLIEVLIRRSHSRKSWFSKKRGKSTAPNIDRDPLPSRPLNYRFF